MRQASGGPSGAGVGPPTCFAMHGLEQALSPSLSAFDPTAVAVARPLSAAQAAAVAEAEAIAATAAAEVAAEAAATAQAAVDTAVEAAKTAAAKAVEVAARAVLAAAAAVETPDLTHAEQRADADVRAAAAIKVALSVRAVAAATSHAAIEAAAVVAEQSASDVAATAAAVTYASSQPGSLFETTIDLRATVPTPVDQTITTAAAPSPEGVPTALSYHLRVDLAVEELRLQYQHASMMLAMHQDGASVLTVAASLNAEGSRTARGRRWTAKSVTRALGGAAT